MSNLKAKRIVISPDQLSEFVREPLLVSHFYDAYLANPDGTSIEHLIYARIMVKQLKLTLDTK